MWVLLFQNKGSAFLISVLFGLAVGLLYDFFRVGRVIINGGKIRLFFEDVLFSAVCALMFCVLIFNTTMGTIRLFTVLGFSIGFFVYRFSLGLLTVPFAKWLKALIARPIKRLKCYAVKSYNCFVSVTKTVNFNIGTYRAAKNGFA